MQRHDETLIDLLEALLTSLLTWPLLLLVLSIFGTLDILSIGLTLLASFLPISTGMRVASLLGILINQDVHLSGNVYDEIVYLTQYHIEQNYWGFKYNNYLMFFQFISENLDVVYSAIGAVLGLVAHYWIRLSFNLRSRAIASAIESGIVGSMFMFVEFIFFLFAILTVPSGGYVDRASTIMSSAAKLPFRVLVAVVLGVFVAMVVRGIRAVVRLVFRQLWAS